MLRSSLVIPTSNRPTKLLRAVESALKALPDESEIIVVDDASDDPATNVLAHLSDAPLRIFRNDTALGAGGSPSRNVGARAARGRTLFFLDDDDEIKPDYQKFILDHVVENASVDARYGFCLRTFVAVETSNEVTYKDEKRSLRDGIVASGALFKNRTFPFSSGFWMTREAYEGVGPFSEDLRTNSDTDYSIRLFAKQYPCWFSATPGVLIDQGDHQKSGEEASVTKRTKSAERAVAFGRIAERNAATLHGNPQIAYYVYSRYMKHLLRSGNTAEAWRILNLAPHPLVKARLAAFFAAQSIFSRQAS